MISQPAEHDADYDTGTIVPDDGGASIECLINNISDAGARIRCQANVGFPDRFHLCMPDGSVLPCEVTGRSPQSIGVRFTHKPKRHD